MGGKSSTQRECFFTRCLPILFTWKRFSRTVKYLSGHERGSLNNPAEKFLPKVRDFFPRSAKKTILVKFFLEKVFPQNVPLET